MFDAVKARIQKIEDQEKMIGAEEHFLPPVTEYAFWFRICLFEIAAHGDGIRGVRKEMESFHPKEIQQILDLKKSDWDSEHWERIAAVQNNIRAAMAK